METLQPHVTESLIRSNSVIQKKGFKKTFNDLLISLKSILKTTVSKIDTLSELARDIK